MKRIGLIEQDGQLVPVEPPPEDAIKTVIDMENRVMTVYQPGDEIPE